MGITTAMTSQHLTRSELWSTELKEVLEEKLMGTNYVNWMTDFPDGEEFKIPSVGEASVRDYIEDTDIVYDSLDSGEFDFKITEYKSAALYITKKARQDSFYSGKLEASFVPKMQRALDEELETALFSLAGISADSVGRHSQSDDANIINGAPHRYVGTGTNVGSAAVANAFAFEDAARALFALKKAHVPDQNLIAFVDPSVELQINALSNLTSLVSPNQRWENIVEEGIASGSTFLKNIYGFDVYSTNFLSETSGTLGNGYVQNIFYSAAGDDINPFVGAFRQMPEVDSEYNKDKQREEYLVTSRYGLDLYRPENLVVVLTNTAVS